MLTAAGGQKRFCTVSGPLFAPVRAYYGRLDSGAAVVETAACAGLPLVRAPNPLYTTTYGVGELVLAAAGSGAERIIVGLGGSATNDGGCGMAAALGVRFYNGRGGAFVPWAARCATSPESTAPASTNGWPAYRSPPCATLKIRFYGPKGAAYVFGPRKGADAAAVAALDAGLRHLAAVAARDLGTGCAGDPGAALQAGLFGMRAFLGAELKNRIETALDAAGFDALFAGADLVVTGEGRLDAQSGMGKAVGGVARRAKRAGVPVIALAGGIDGAYSAGLGLTPPLQSTACRSRCPSPAQGARRTCTGRRWTFSG